LVFLPLFLLAIPLFLLPVRTLHRQQVVSKASELDWIGRRYASAFAAIKAAPPSPLSNEIKTELAAIRQLREDVERANTWPFDTEVFARLVAIVLTVSGILISTVIRDVFGF
jgi:hypothetical protein